MDHGQRLQGTLRVPLKGVGFQVRQLHVLYRSVACLLDEGGCSISFKQGTRVGNHLNVRSCVSLASDIYRF
jgi:hypothetical protein